MGSYLFWKPRKGRAPRLGNELTGQNHELPSLFVRLDRRGSSRHRLEFLQLGALDNVVAFEADTLIFRGIDVASPCHEA